MRTASPQRFGLVFNDPDLLQQALTHRSFGSPHNERLEYLGDAVLNLSIARLLFEHFPDADEGSLSRTRANLVNQGSLHRQAQQLDIGKHLWLGDGEARSGGYSRPSILADALEAIIGAVLLDEGFDAAYAFVARLFSPLIAEVITGEGAKDAKTALQEWLQAHKLPVPKYHVRDTLGAAHEQTFVIEAVIDDLALAASGDGASKRAAEQVAAARLLALLQAPKIARQGRKKRPND